MCPQVPGFTSHDEEAPWWKNYLAVDAIGMTEIHHNLKGNSRYHFCTIRNNFNFKPTLFVV
jgi:hypothetical protein